MGYDFFHHQWFFHGLFFFSFLCILLLVYRCLRSPLSNYGLIRLVFFFFFSVFGPWPRSPPCFFLVLQISSLDLRIQETNSYSFDYLLHQVAHCSFILFFYYWASVLLLPPTTVRCLLGFDPPLHDVCRITIRRHVVFLVNFSFSCLLDYGPRRTRFNISKLNMLKLIYILYEKKYASAMFLSCMFHLPLNMLIYLQRVYRVSCFRNSSLV